MEASGAALSELSSLLEQLDQASIMPLWTAASRSESQRGSAWFAGRDGIRKRHGKAALRAASDGCAGLEQRHGRSGSGDGAVQDSLLQARTVEAEGAEGAAADRLRQAQEALEQAAAAMAQMQQAMQGQGRGGDRAQAQRGDEEERNQEPIEIPAPEEFQSPEEYRRALLEGMQGEVPGEFEALKRRYYEELVRQ